MRNVNYIAIHCTATQPETSIASIQNYWKNNLGWKNPGYHFIIDRFGNVENLLPIELVSNGVQGYNLQTINISYVGGIDKSGKPKDTRTEAQKQSILKLLKELRVKFPKAKIQGHRDFPNVKKACPSFDAKKEYILI